MSALLVDYILSITYVRGSQSETEGPDMLNGLTRRIIRLESSKTKLEPKSVESFLAEVFDYAQRRGLSFDEASSTLMQHISTEDLERFVVELEECKGSQ